MTPAGRQVITGPEFHYHLLRNALQVFNRNPHQLDADEYGKIYEKTERSFALESLVLASDEAKRVVIPERILDESVALVVARYPNPGEYLLDLSRNGLDEQVLRSALRRELIFDATMQRVAFGCAEVSDIDVGLFYELHRTRFAAPETRIARHIMITVNPDYPENRRGKAFGRMTQIESKLKARIDRFHEFAMRYSECPTAMQGGRLGAVTRGQLYDALDAVLFSMAAAQISPVVESELGFHILLCEKIKPGKQIPLSDAAPGIRRLLWERRRRRRQQDWIASLQGESGI